MLTDPNPVVIDSAPSHTHRVFDLATFPAVVDWVVATARAQRYDALAACGHSGLLVAGAAAYILNVPVIAVRKAGDHAKGDSRRVNAVLPAGLIRYAFVDDMICSGETLETVITEIEKTDPDARCAAIILYTPHALGADPFDWARKRFAPNDPRLLGVRVFVHPPTLKG